MAAELDLPRSFVADAYERYARHFVERLRSALGGWHERPLSALDLSCGTGFATQELAKLLPPRSRIIAISDDRPSLTEFHRALPPELRPQIFVRKERPERLPFALGSFDLAWACQPTRILEPARSIARQALRVLRPGGLLVICTPLRGSFLELITAAGRELTLQRLVAERAQLPDLDQWRDSLRRAGGIELGTERASIQLLAAPPLSRDRLLSLHLSPLWLGRRPSSGPEMELLDRMLDQPLEVTVHIGCLWARRGFAEIEESSAS